MKVYFVIFNTCTGMILMKILDIENLKCESINELASMFAVSLCTHAAQWLQMANTRPK